MTSTEPLEEVVLEGTNFSEQDKDDRLLHVPLQPGVGPNRREALVRMSDVANVLSDWMAINDVMSTARETLEREEAARAIKCGRNARPIAALSKQEKEDVINRMEQTISVGLHFSNMNPDRFYRTVYLRGDRVLASDLNKLLPESKHPLPYQFGVDMPHLTNREAVVELERFGMESLSAEEVKWLEKHAEARRSEIHPPITSKAKLSAYLHTHWRAIELPSEQECACHRPHIDCVIGRSLPMHPNSKTIDLAQLSLLLRQMHDENEQFLSRIGTDRAMGAVWYSMDSVFSRLSIFTDQDEPLQDLIRDSLERALLPG